MRANPFVHQLMQACVGASFELCAPSKGLRYISRNGILSHPRCGAAKDVAQPLAIPIPGSNGVTIIPDDLFGLEYPGSGFRFFAVEIDRNTESITRKQGGYTTWSKKVAGYLALLRHRLYREWWGIPNLTILVVTTSGLHARNILDYVASHCRPAEAERFLFTFEPQFGTNWRVPKNVLSGMLDESWFTTTGGRDVSRP